MKTEQKSKFARKVIGIALLLLACGFGYMLRGCHGDVEVVHDHAIDGASVEKSAEIWTCSMHPQIKLPKPGKCPLCGMDLILLNTGTDETGGVRELSVSEASSKLMEIETSPVERRFVTARVRMVGKIDYDETRISYITAWVPGRLERLFVNYTGVPVKKGDHMVSIYSPELLGAQQELIQAIHAVEQLQQSNVNLVRETTEATVGAVREKLRLWGLTPEQIEATEQRGEPEDRMTIYAPAGGIVIQKNAQEGMYVNTGMRIYTIADLSRMWVKLDAYESDLAWLRYGQHIAFTTVAYPGETFTGTISFIDPVLDEATRTVKVRVNVPNADGRLKPGMFVRAVAEAQVATGGRVMDASLAGKWICPMHPEIIKDGPDACDVCGMPLAQAENLGYVGKAATDADKPLVIPATAPLLTGRRAVVYVEVSGKDRPTFEGREIVLGPRAGDDYLVNEGLEEGDRVVTKGAFKLDAELQIQAKPSMMSPEDDKDADMAGMAGMAGMDHATPMRETAEMAKADSSPLSPEIQKPAAPLNPDFKKQLGKLIEGYLGVQAALAKDAETEAAASAKTALEALAKVDMNLVAGQDHADWMKQAGELKSLLDAVASAKGIESSRAQFALLSEQVATLVARFGVPSSTLYKAWCPMAFDGRGAWWIQDTEEINNPYFGETMLRCGEIKEVMGDR